MNIIDIANEFAAKENVKVINEIEIEIGEVSGVVYEALEFALECIVKNTILENARRTIIKISGKARCVSCSNEFKIEDLYTPCPNCGHFGSDIIQGKELRVKSLVVD